MQLVTASIRQEILEDVLDALNEVGIHGVTVAAAEGSGRNDKQRTEIYKSVAWRRRLRPVVRIELVVCRSQVAAAERAIARASFTGRGDDGLIWTTEVTSVVRVADLLRDTEALVRRASA